MIVRQINSSFPQQGHILTICCACHNTQELDRIDIGSYEENHHIVRVAVHEYN